MAGDATVFLNLNDQAMEGQFEWMTWGVPVTYANWNDGQPSRSGDCVVSTPTGWNDVDCKTPQKFVCGRCPDPPPPSAPPPSAPPPAPASIPYKAGETELVAEELDLGFNLKAPTSMTKTGNSLYISTENIAQGDVGGHNWVHNPDWLLKVDLSSEKLQ